MSFVKVQEPIQLGKGSQIKDLTEQCLVESSPDHRGNIWPRDQRQVGLLPREEATSKKNWRPGYQAQRTGSSTEDNREYMRFSFPAK